MTVHSTDWNWQQQSAQSSRERETLRYEIEAVSKVLDEPACRGSYRRELVDRLTRLRSRLTELE